MILLTILKKVGGPGSLGFFLLCLGLGFAMLRGRGRVRRAGTWCLAATFCAYLVLSVPQISGELSSQLPALAGQRANDESATMIVILDGDNRLGRAREAGRICAKNPSLPIWLLGGNEMRDAVVAEGISMDRVMWRGDDRSTLDQMARVRGLATEHPGEHIAVVASRLQMPRIEALARAMKLPLRLLAAPLDAEPPQDGWRRYVPSLTALIESRDAIYEHAALAYYRWRGWI